MHLASGESASYRFDLFPWLNKVIKDEKVKSVLILGDLTDAKDGHSAELVNKIVTAVDSLACDDVKILSGNHDWLRQGHEFFKFLNRLPHVQFITEPMEDQDTQGPLTMYLPYSKNPAKDWAGFDFSHYQYLFMHQTIKGAIASNGQAMEGEDLPSLADAGKVYSGDIHVPQVIGPIEYVGSPYAVHFGDKFKPRVLLLERDGNPVDLHFETISRQTIKVASCKELARLKFRAGDQVKLRMELDESEKHDWAKLRKAAGEILKDAGVQVHGIELILKKTNHRLVADRKITSFRPADILLQFVQDEELGGDAFDLGVDLLEKS